MLGNRHRSKDKEIFRKTKLSGYYTGKTAKLPRFSLDAFGFQMNLSTKIIVALQCLATLPQGSHK